MNAKYPEISTRTYYSFEEPADECETDGPTGQFIQDPGLSNEPLEQARSKMGFWRRQFNDQVTIGQKKFDWIFGVILPVICFYFDPVVFVNAHDDFGMLFGIKTFAYTLSFLAIVATMAWLLWGEKLKWLNGFLSGLFAISSVAALAIGVVLAPISFIGLIIVIGALGFTPLFCSFVLLRNSVRAFRAAKLSVDRQLVSNSFVLAALASAVIPYLLNLW